jgi:enoyl-CoA hydratase/carnithine racemase
MNSEPKSPASAPETPLVAFTSEGPIARLTLSRGAKYNVLSRAMIAALVDALARLAGDESVRVIVIAAEGKAFSAGHDLGELGADADEAALRALFAACADLMLAIQRQPQPVIARVQGVATAAGCQLVSMCDLAVASEDARFAVSGINVGLFCSTPAVGLSRNVAQKPAMEMLLTGEFIDAARAREIGLVNRVVPAAELDAEVARLAATIAGKSHAAIALGKRFFYEQRELGIVAAYARAGEVMTCNAALPDAREGIAKFTKRGA